MERIFIVPLRKARRGSSTRFSPKAIKYIRSFVGRHMKADDVIIGKNLNEFVWSRGVKNPPRRVEIRSTKKQGIAYVEINSISDAVWTKFISQDVKSAKKAEKVKPPVTKKKPVKKPTVKKKTPVKKKPAKTKTVKKAAPKAAKKKAVVKKKLVKKAIPKVSKKTIKPTKKTVKKAAPKKTKATKKKTVKKAAKPATKKTPAKKKKGDKK